MSKIHHHLLTSLVASAALAAFMALVLAASQPAQAQTTAPTAMTTPQRYGLIDKMKAQPGQRDALAAILLEGTQAMPGCLSYIVALDPKDPDALWITEVWDSAASHKASLALPAVKDAITRGRPLIAGFGERYETVPVGGTGVPAGRQ